MDHVLYSDDIVSSRSDPKKLAVVERTHEDVDSHIPFPGRDEANAIRHAKDINLKAFKKFMRDGVPPKGTVLIRWTNTEDAELISMSKLILLDRSLLIGDIVKRQPQDAMSGVVINTYTSCTLQPMCDVKYRSGPSLKGLLPPSERLSNGVKLAHSPALLIDIPASELTCEDVIMEDDIAIYKDWIGRVDSVAANITLKLADGTAVEISDEHAEHVDGSVDRFALGDIAMTKKGHLRTGKWIFGQYNPNTHPIGTVVRYRPVAVEFTWLERRLSNNPGPKPARQLEREELESSAFKIYDRTRKSVRPDSKMKEDRIGTISNSEIDVRLQLRVRFKDLVEASSRYDGSTRHGRLIPLNRQDTLGYDINVFDIVGLHATVTIQWQDLSISHLKSIDLIPDNSIDDHSSVWPSEIAHTLVIAPSSGDPNVEQPSKVGVIQSVNPAERMAKIRWSPNALVQYSVDPDVETGEKTLITGIVGLATGEVEEVSLYDIDAPATMNVRRGDIVLIANRKWTPESGPPSPDNTDWIGEIVDTCLDGTLIIRLGAADMVQDVKMKREDIVLVIRSDGTDDFDDWGENVDDDSDDVDDDPLMQGTEFMIDEDGFVDVWHGPGEAQEGYDVDEWIHGYDSDDANESEAEEDQQVRYMDENGDPMDVEEVENGEWESEDEEEDNALDKDTKPTSEPHTVVPSTKGLSSAELSSAVPSLSSLEQPPNYVVLEQSVPTSHPYAHEPASDSAQHLKRVQKEHRILQKPSAIPTGVYVRTWESRLDLIRILFIGPADTPYDSAPFVVDLYLPPHFPTEPPQAFFHSFPGESGLGGAGRINPNLYEDGKICLSLLGTWSGNRGEGWSAGQSTVLQVIVSILGLVLVKEPYFNEAGYEHLAGLEASKRPSALYNERTFLKAKSFVITALSRPSTSDGKVSRGLEGVEDVIEWSYITANGPKLLDKVIHDVESVLRTSDEGRQESDGLTVMSKGACIPLRRVLERLKQLQQPT